MSQQRDRTTPRLTSGPLSQHPLLAQIPGPLMSRAFSSYTLPSDLPFHVSDPLVLE